MTKQADCGTQLWRPVQFLGSKLRSLEHISDSVKSLTSDKQRIWEPFSGSSIVSQKLAADGQSMWACDALKSSTQFARAMLGVNRTEYESPLSDLANEAVNFAKAQVNPLWERELDLEATALDLQDGQQLLTLGARLPQRWRRENSSHSQLEFFDQVEQHSLAPENRFRGLFSATYAGSYFGLRQSLDLEALREAIFLLTRERPNSWEFSALVTALCHVASQIVYSPGKHFAQPHRIHDQKDVQFHARRALKDRALDVPKLFMEAVRSIEGTARPSFEDHRADNLTCGSVTASDLEAQNVGTVYADPPYTAQQYSRFYHLLETVVSGEIPKLQIHRSKVTRGLYPEGRYLSPFSSKTKAPDAFKDLIDKSYKSDSNLVISYSGGMGKSSGNLRMVSMEEIIDWVGSYYGKNKVHVSQLELRYRQFNNSRKAVTERNEPEFLVIGER